MWKECKMTEKSQESINGSHLPLDQKEDRRIDGEDDVRMDLQKMKIKNWKRSVLDRDSWRTIVERTKTRKEL